MTHRDRSGDRTGHRAGSREAAGDAGHRPWLSDARRRFACATGTAVSQSFRAAHSFETGHVATDGIEGVHFWGLDPDPISILCSWKPRERAFILNSGLKT